jgi:hypothetical protein
MENIKSAEWIAHISIFAQFIMTWLHLTLVWLKAVRLTAISSDLPIYLYFMVTYMLSDSIKVDDTGK